MRQLPYTVIYALTRGVPGTRDWECYFHYARATADDADGARLLCAKGTLEGFHFQEVLTLEGQVPPLGLAGRDYFHAYHLFPEEFSCAVGPAYDGLDAALRAPGGRG